MENLLPNDGTVNYYGKIFSDLESSEYLKALIHEIDWKNDKIVLFGKHIVTKRMVAWYGGRNYRYTYSGSTREALPWTKTLASIKKSVERACGEKFNSCLLNLYHSGEESMGWHSDAEKELAEDGAIASVSFGAMRRFDLKHKLSGETTSVFLESGSLLIMRGTTQKHWLHRLPATKKISEPRINLTFRMMKG